ncbi:MAG: BatB protein [Flavobacteriaceae bacterium]|nr:BatB protein [Flavobacteriaceae bacterium]
MYILDDISYSYLFILLPILIFIFILSIRWKYRMQNRIISKKMINALIPHRSNFKIILKFSILFLSIILLVIGLINPKIGTELETVKREGVDIVFALDVSKSMLAEDIAPNRIEKAKRLVSAIINNLVGDRIGIIVYASRAIPQLPITTDYNSGKMFLQSINTDMMSSQGTALNSALDLSGTFFSEDDQTNRVVFLISDGEDHSDEAQTAARRASSNGIKIFTFGIGTDSGAPIPIKNNGILETYKKDEKGDVVITKKNSDILKQISDLSGGKYIDGNNTENVLKFVSEELKNMEKKEFEAKKFVSYKDRFQIFLLISFLLLIIELFIFETETIWLRNLNLFNEKNQSE